MRILDITVTDSKILRMGTPNIASEVHKLVGRALAAERRRRTPPLSQHALAARTNGSLSRSAIANIESGRQRIALHHLYELARALQVEPTKLLPSLDRVLELVSPTNSVFPTDPAAQEFTERVLRLQSAHALTRGAQRDDD